MFPQRYDSLDIIDVLQRSKNTLESYVTNREELITKRQREISKLKLKCEETARRTDLRKKFTEHFFAERDLIRQTALNALDKAIEHGDEDIADIALAILGKEYGQDFFGMLKKI